MLRGKHAPGNRSLDAVPWGLLVERGGRESLLLCTDWLYRGPGSGRQRRDRDERSEYEQEGGHPEGAGVASGLGYLGSGRGQRLKTRCRDGEQSCQT